MISTFQTRMKMDLQATGPWQLQANGIKHTIISWWTPPL